MTIPISTLPSGQNVDWASAGAGSIGASTAVTIGIGNTSCAITTSGTVALTANGASSFTTSSGALTLTSAVAATWSTSAGALTINGFGGINLQVNGATVADVGVTTAANLTLAANKTLAGAAGTGGVSLGNLTGATALPTGNLSWAGASTKTLSLVGASTFTLTAGAASTWSSSSGALTITSAAAATWSTAAGALTVDSAAALNLGTGLATSVAIGASGITTTINGSSVLATPSNTATALKITDSTNSYYITNTQTGTSGVTAHTFANTAPSFASAAGNSYHLANLASYTLTQTGSTGVTALSGLSLLVNSPTVTNSSAGLTIATVSAVQINGPLPAGNAVFGTSVALDIPAYATNGTTAAGLRIASPTGSSAAYAIQLVGNSSIQCTASVNLTAATGGVTLSGTGTGVSLIGAGNVANGLQVQTGGSVNWYVINTQTGTDQTISHSFSVGSAISYAAATSSSHNLAALNAYTLTLTGTTAVTALDGLMLKLAAPTITDASAVVVAEASTLYLSPPIAAGSVTITANNIINTSVAGCFLTATGVWTSTSGRDTKKGIYNADQSRTLADLDSVSPVRYQYKDTSDGEFERYGLIAEDVPDFLASGNRKGLAAIHVGGFAVAACKALKAMLDAAEQRIAALESRLA